MLNLFLLAKISMLLLNSQDVCFTMLNCPFLLTQRHRPSCIVRHTDKQKTYTVKRQVAKLCKQNVYKVQTLQQQVGSREIGARGREGRDAARPTLFLPSVPHMLKQA